MQKTFEHTFSRRTVALFIFVLVLMLVCVLRIYELCNATLQTSNTDTNTLSLTVAELRGNIFDANMVSLTGNEVTKLAALTDNPQDIMALAKLMSGDELERNLERLGEGKPILVEATDDCGAKTVVVRHERTTNTTLAKHLLGYVGASGRGACGIEAACDDMLYTGEKLKVVFSVDAHGQALLGVGPKIQGDTSVYDDGVALTIDARIQSAAENAMQSIKRGAALVFEVENCKIRAMVSRPDYDPANISKSMNDDASPLINRALYAYNVGSAFKPLIAAAAIEQGTYHKMNYTCKGSSIIAGRKFNCNNENGHGNMNLSQAIAFSCNTYFYELANRCGAKNIYNMARQLNMGNTINLANGITAQSGSITSLNTLNSSPAAVANFAIGQGDVLLSPVSVGYMYCAIAGDGTYRIAPLVEGQVKNKQIVTPKQQTNATRAFSEKTAKILREYLIGTVNDGTGKLARPKTCTAGGKTATAQTGWIKDQKSVTQGWFCGFFPAENPKYVAIILAEDVSSGGEECAPVFAALADSVCALNLS